jgi:hypothetical protein
MSKSIVANALWVLAAESGCWKKRKRSALYHVKCVLDFAMFMQNELRYSAV